MKGDIDPIYMDNNGVLKNKLGLTDAEDIEKLANRLSSSLALGIMGLGQMNVPVRIEGWNESFLKDLHKAMFDGIYDWAGEYRKIDIGISFDHVAYEPWENVPEKLNKVFEYIRKHNCFKGMKVGDQVKNLALVFGNIKNLQPFRDGNTRTALLFTSLLAGECGKVLDYAFLDQENFRLAQVRARDGDYNPLVLQFAQITLGEKDIPKLKMPKVIVSKTKDNINELCNTKTGSETYQPKVKTIWDIGLR